MAKKAAIVIGIVLILVGIWGFVQNPVAGLFNVNVLHDLVHIITGIVLLIGAGKAAAATLKWVGIIYVIVAIIGFIWGLGFLGVGSGGDADNYLHLLLGIVLAAFGWAGAPKMDTMSAPQM